jgi:hypothetical protein
VVSPTEDKKSQLHPSPCPHALLTVGAFSYDLWVSLFILKDDLATYTILKKKRNMNTHGRVWATGACAFLGMPTP